MAMPIEEFDHWAAFYAIETKQREEALDKAKREAEVKRSSARSGGKRQQRR